MEGGVRTVAEIVAQSPTLIPCGAVTVFASLVRLINLPEIYAYV